MNDSYSNRTQHESLKRHAPAIRPTFLLFILALGVTGCSTTGKRVQWYDGEKLSTNKIAVLTIQRDFLGVNLAVDKVDGEPLNKGKRFVANNTREIDLLPGRHEFWVSYADSDAGHSITDGQISFVADAGKTYEMRAAPEERSFGTELRLAAIGGEFHWLLWIVDTGTGNVVAGQPRLAPQHWYEK